MIDNEINQDLWRVVMDCFYEVAFEDYLFARNVRVLQTPDARVGFLCISPCQNGFPAKFLKPIIQYLDTTAHYLVLEQYGGKVAAIVY